MRRRLRTWHIKSVCLVFPFCEVPSRSPSGLRDSLAFFASWRFILGRWTSGQVVTRKRGLNDLLFSPKHSEAKYQTVIRTRILDAVRIGEIEGHRLRDLVISASQQFHFAVFEGYLSPICSRQL